MLDVAAQSAVPPPPQVLASRFAVGELLSQTPRERVYRGTDLRAKTGVRVVFLVSDALSAMTYEGLSNLAESVFSAQREIQSSCFCFSDYYGIHEGQIYVVYQKPDGIPLREYLKRGWNYGDLAEVVRRLLSVLGKTHVRNIFHLDLNPDTIFISAADNEPIRVEVYALGHAQLRAGEGSNMTLMTRSSQTISAPEYLAPEVFAGKPADARSDLYSIGCVLFEALTGEVPFRADSLIDLLLMHMHNEVPELQLAKQPAAKRAEQEAAQELVQLTIAMLQKHPAERPKHVHECLDKLHVPQFSTEHRWKRDQLPPVPAFAEIPFVPSKTPVAPITAPVEVEPQFEAGRETAAGTESGAPIEVEPESAVPVELPDIELPEVSGVEAGLQQSGTAAAEQPPAGRVLPQSASAAEQSKTPKRTFLKSGNVLFARSLKPISGTTYLRPSDRGWLMKGIFLLLAANLVAMLGLMFALRTGRIQVANDSAASPGRARLASGADTALREQDAPPTADAEMAQILARAERRAAKGLAEEEEQRKLRTFEVAPNDHPLPSEEKPAEFATLGFSVLRVTEALAKSRGLTATEGLVVESCDRDGVAFTAGLRKRDVIRRAETRGENILVWRPELIRSVEDLEAAVDATLGSNSRLALIVRRGGFDGLVVFIQPEIKRDETTKNGTKPLAGNDSSAIKDQPAAPPETKQPGSRTNSSKDAAKK